MPLSLARLATFVRLTEDPSFTRVAEAAGLTQPAVTHQIRTLERDLGVRLVDIVARRAEITEAGAFLAERGKRLLASADALEREMHDLAAARAGAIRLGATLTIGATLLPALLARFKAAHPSVQASVEIANTAQIGEMVQAGRLSAALVEGTLDDAELRIEVFADDELVLVAPPDHPLAGKRVRVEALGDEPFVGREPGSGTRDVLERALRAHGVVPEVVLAIPSGEGIVRAVEAGLGIAALSRLVVADALAARRIVGLHVPGLDLRRPLSLVTRRLRSVSPAVVAFREVVLTQPAPSG